MSTPQERDDQHFPKAPGEFCIRLMSRRGGEHAIPLGWLGEAMRRVGGRDAGEGRFAFTSVRHALAVLDVLCERFGPCFEAADGAGGGK